MTYFIIKDTLIIIYLLYTLYIFLNKTNLKGKNVIGTEEVLRKTRIDHVHLECYHKLFLRAIQMQIST
jgi:hypothetical protein